MNLNDILDDIEKAESKGRTIVLGEVAGSVDSCIELRDALETLGYNANVIFTDGSISIFASTQGTITYRIILKGNKNELK